MGIHTHDDAGCGVANSLVAVEAGARLVQGTMNGYGERCGNANLVIDPAGARAEAGLRVRSARSGCARLTEAAHLVDELCNVTPNPNQPYVGANAFAHKGGMHVAGVNARRAHVRAHRPGGRGRRPRACWSRSCRARARCRRAPSVDDATAARVVERVKELENRGYQFEAADGSFDLLIRKETGDYEPLFRLESWRAIVEKREDGRVQTEATIKIWVDGERYVSTAEGNGPVHALDKALRDGDRRALPAPPRHPARELQGAHPGRGEGHRRRSRACCSTPATARDTWGSIGVSENIIEASWEALVDSLEAGMLPARGGRAAPARASRERADPARAAARRRARGASWCSRRCAPGACRSARGCRSSRSALAERLGAEHVSAVSSGTAGLHLAIRAAGVEPGDEVVTTPFSFVASANCLLYEGARPVFCDIDPRTLNIDPEAAAAAVGERTTGLLPGAHLRLPGRHAGAGAAGRASAGSGSWRTPARRSARCTRDGAAVGARGNLAVFGFYPNKQITTGEGGAVVLPDAERARRASTPSATRAARPTWAGSTTTGSASTTASTTSPARSAWRSSSASTSCWRSARAWPPSTPRRWPTSRGSSCPARTRAATAAAGSSTWSSSRAAWTATPRSRRCASAAWTRSPTCRRIHLISFYRERFGHREGEFPVCEDVARRSLALPFFPRADRGRGRAGRRPRCAR